MPTEYQRVLLEPVPPWSEPANSILGSHFGAADYLLTRAGNISVDLPVPTYFTNEQVWHDIGVRKIAEGTQIRLEHFQLLDWFPRAPGLFHTPRAEFARSQAFQHLHRGFPASPIRDHAGAGTSGPRANDYTVVFTPQGKMSMLEGGIGAIRLKPLDIFGGPHWLMTASSDGVTHTGVPLAIPRKLYSPLLASIYASGAVCATVTGDVEFVPDPFSRLFDRAVMVPKVILRVTGIEQSGPTSKELETSVAVSFVSEYRGAPQVYATYVTFQPAVEGSFEDAVSWMKREYVEGEYRGRIITDFDQTQTIFPEARVALSSVMNGSIARGELRETIELMHASASVDAYFDEVGLRDLLPDEGKGSRTKVFISYAHAAERETGWVDRIRTHLKGLVLSSDFEVWDDSKIEPSQKWHEEIEQAIRQTRVAVLVLTADFLASKFIREAELPPLLEAAEAAGASIFCIYGKGVYLSGIAKRLLQYQFVNEPERPLHSLSEAEREAVYKKLAISVDKVLSGSR